MKFSKHGILTVIFLTVFLLNCLAHAQVWTSNTAKLGNGAASNKRIILNRGASNPEIRWNESTGQIEISNNGTVFTTLGNPIGMVAPFATIAVPTGWLECDGSLVSRTTFANLFAAIGTAHGSGDGSTTFALPDYRGRFLRHVDGTAGRDPDKLTRTAMNSGGAVGNNVGSVQVEQLLSHTHSTSALDNFVSVFGNTTGPAGIRGTYGGASALTTLDALTRATGGNETRPINAYVRYMIKH